ncbi:uncharacterized protein M8220_013270 [Acridotheres tristis]
MAAFLLLAPLLLLGTVAGQETARCPWFWNATEGNFSVETSPETYQANTTYLVTIKDGRNHNSSSRYLLQALSAQNSSVGTWQGNSTRNCSSVDTAELNITESTASWTSPNSSLASVQIRVYLSLPNNSTELKTVILSTGAGNSTELPPNSTLSPSTNHSSVCRAQGSSWLLPALLLLTALLLS